MTVFSLVWDIGSDEGRCMKTCIFLKNLQKKLRQDTIIVQV